MFVKYSILLIFLTSITLVKNKNKILVLFFYNEIQTKFNTYMRIIQSNVCS